MIWIVLAVLLLAIAALLIVAAVLDGAAPVEVDPAGISVDTTVSGVFITGIVTGLLVLGGIAAVLVGIQQVRAHRKEIEYLRQRVAEQDKTARPAGNTQVDPSPDKSTGKDKRDKGEAEMAGTSRREKRRTDRSADVS